MLEPWEMRSTIVGYLMPHTPYTYTGWNDKIVALEKT